MEKLNRHMLVLARESRGLTQKGLAGQTGFSQSKVSKFEHGALDVDADDLATIASVLDYPVGFFYQMDSVYGLTSNCLYHRKKKAMRSGDLKITHATVNIIRMQVARLLSKVEIDAEERFFRMDIDEMDGDAEVVAQIVRSTWGIPNGPIENLVEVVESAGGIIVPWDFGTHSLDAMSQWTPGLPPIFFINSRKSADRIRWSLSHEIGHVVMHAIPTPDLEREADRFAAEFLMPDSVIRDEFPSSVTLPSLASMKARWRVAIQALARRAHDLEVISHRQYQRLFTGISKLGWRKREPVEIPKEKPQLMTQLIDALLEHTPIAELADSLNTKVDQIDTLANRPRPDIRIVR